MMLLNIMPSLSSFTVFLFVLVIIMYSVPSTLSAYLKIDNLRTIVIVNFFAFTIIGWFIAFGMFLYGLKKQYKLKDETDKKVETVTDTKAETK